MTKSNITNCIGTYNSFPFLKLAIESIRKNEYFKSPLIVFADGCTDGTNEWLIENKEKYDITTIIEDRCENSSNGYGMNRCATEVQTEFINFIHADMYCAKNFDLALYNKIKSYPDIDRVVISSYRIQPNIFHNGQEPDRPGTIMVDPTVFGDSPENFNSITFDQTAEAFTTDYKELTVPKVEGCSFIIRKRDWDYIGGNDLRFKPNGFDDMDLFIRMKIEKYKYETIGASVVYHFAGRGGNGFFGKGLNSRNESNQMGEVKSSKAFLEKWGEMPTFDEYGMVKLINL
jgi:glycosyltransferase involved in cell wall biosynthesis